MAIIADPCWAEGLGVDNLTGIPGIKNLRHVAWPYTASITTATGLKYDPSTGFPYTDPIDGVSVASAGVSAGRGFSGDPGTTGVSMLTGAAPWISASITNTLHRDMVVIYSGVMDYRWTVTEYSSFSANDAQYLAQIVTVATNATAADPGSAASNATNAITMGGLVTAGFGGAVLYGGRDTRVEIIGTIAPGDYLSVKGTPAFNRGSAGYSTGTYDTRVVYLYGFSLIGLPKPPAS